MNSWWFFTEHMLFYANEKYPVEDSYMKYLTEVYLIFTLAYTFKSQYIGSDVIYFEVR
jgi:hypothetical protein